MHASITQLLDWAKRASASWPPGRRVETLAKLRTAMDVSPQVFTNWKQRGISVEGALRAEQLFGIPTSALLSTTVLAGEPTPRWIESQHQDAGNIGSLPHLARPVRLLGEESLPLMSWEALMHSEKLPARFRVEIGDHALSPDLHPGDQLYIDRELDPQPGDLALLRDAAGNHIVRFLQQSLPGQWTATAPNAAFAPLDVRTNGLTIVGVSYSETRRRRRSIG